MSKRWSDAENDLCIAESGEGIGWEGRVHAQLPGRSLEAIREHGSVLGLRTSRWSSDAEFFSQARSDAQSRRFTNHRERLRLSQLRIHHTQRRRAMSQ